MQATETQTPVYALVGNPNSGKTTIFNHLTGLKQKVGNYAGVTVDMKEGTCYSQHGEKIKLIDLPGTYSLSAHSPDEKVLQQALMGRLEGTDRPERVICVADASNLERSLFLAAQVAELGRPTLLVLNMMDITEKRGVFIDTGRIEKALGVTVVPTQAHKKVGLMTLKLAMSRKQLPQPTAHLDLPQLICEAVVNIQATLLEKTNGHLGRARGEALLLLTEGANTAIDSAITVELVESWQRKLDQDLQDWRSLIIQSRYKRVDAIIKESVFKRNEMQKTLTEHIDSVLLHKTFGWVGLMAVMGVMFFSIFTLAEYPMMGIEWCFERIGDLVRHGMPEGPLKGLLVEGVISGVGSVMVFLPQIMLLFLFIGLLESSGYLPRAAFILDKLMSKVGLQGRSFIPLLSSFACAVPGILATRTIRSTNERLATIMIAPWMSCSARLPVYLLMIAALVPTEVASPWVKSGILLGAYSLGTVVAFMTAWIFRKTLLKGKSEGAVMELPDYRVPCWRNALTDMCSRAMMFVKRAGLLIVTFSILIWFLMSYPNGGEKHTIENTYIAQVGKAIEPVIKPLGYDWKIGVGLMGSFAARELFVSTMAVIYNVEDSDELHVKSLVDVMRTQKHADGRYVFSGLTCASLMMFFIFAMQCVSTLVVVRKETNSWRWPLFQLAFMTGFAYLAAFIVYQGGSLFGL